MPARGGDRRQHLTTGGLGEDRRARNRSARFASLPHSAPPESLARAKLVRTIVAAAEVDVKAAQWLLERMDRKNWGRTVDVRAEHSGPNGGPIPIVVADQLGRLQST